MLARLRDSVREEQEEEEVDVEEDQEMRDVVQRAMRQVLLSDPDLGENFNFSSMPFEFFETDLAIKQVVISNNFIIHIKFHEHTQGML